MHSSHRITRAAAVLMVGFLLVMALAGTASAGTGVPRGMTAQQWKEALIQRGQAMNRIYHLGAYSPGAEAQRAVERRNQAINRYYHLGRYSVVRVSSRFAWGDAGIGAGAMLGAILLAGGLAVAVRRRVVGETAPGTT